MPGCSSVTVAVDLAMPKDRPVETITRTPGTVTSRRTMTDMEFRERDEVIESLVPTAFVRTAGQCSTLTGPLVIA